MRNQSPMLDSCPESHGSGPLRNWAVRIAAKRTRTSEALHGAIAIGPTRFPSSPGLNGVSNEQRTKLILSHGTEATENVLKEACRSPALVEVPMEMVHQQSPRCELPQTDTTKRIGRRKQIRSRSDLVLSYNVETEMMAWPTGNATIGATNFRAVLPLNMHALITTIGSGTQLHVPQAG